MRRIALLFLLATVTHAAPPNPQPRIVLHYRPMVNREIRLLTLMSGTDVTSGKIAPMDSVLLEVITTKPLEDGNILVYLRQSPIRHPSKLFLPLVSRENATETAMDNAVTYLKQATFGTALAFRVTTRGQMTRPKDTDGFLYNNAMGFPMLYPNRALEKGDEWTEDEYYTEKRTALRHTTFVDFESRRGLACAHLRQSAHRPTSEFSADTWVELVTGEVVEVDGQVRGSGAKAGTLIKYTTVRV